RVFSGKLSPPFRKTPLAVLSPIILSMLLTNLFDESVSIVRCSSVSVPHGPHRKPRSCLVRLIGGYWNRACEFNLSHRIFLIRPLEIVVHRLSRPSLGYRLF
ncbi:hypothetical protein BDV09DRAFT_170063, partial [Aspergillus tetrazonus]